MSSLSVNFNKQLLRSYIRLIFAHYILCQNICKFLSGKYNWHTESFLFMLKRFSLALLNNDSSDLRLHNIKQTKFLEGEYSWKGQ